jgi:hypothetical protein
MMLLALTADAIMGTGYRTVKEKTLQVVALIDLPPAYCRRRVYVQRPPPEPVDTP